jgi:hypothetical protein
MFKSVFQFNNVFMIILDQFCRSAYIKIIKIFININSYIEIYLKIIEKFLSIYYRINIKISNKFYSHIFKIKLYTYI